MGVKGGAHRGLLRIIMTLFFGHRGRKEGVYVEVSWEARLSAHLRQIGSFGPGTVLAVSGFARVLYLNT